MILAVLIQNKAKLLLAVLLLASLLAGCRANRENTQPVQTEFLALENGQALGQSFTSHFNGLSAVGVIIDPETASRGAIRFTLYSAPGQEPALRQIDIPLASFSYPSLTYFRFPPISGSNQQDYYFSLQWKGDQSISVGATDGSAYPDGAAYLNQEAQDKQLTFELTYGRRLMLIGLAQEMLSWLGILLVTIFLFCIPGWALASVFLPRWDSLAAWTKMILGIGVSFAIYPLLMLWTDLVGLHMGAVYSWLPPVMGLIIILYRNLDKLNPATLRTIRIKLPTWPSIALAVAVFLLVVSRFWVIRTLSIPLWGDSYHHTMIAQLMVDNWGLFDSWLPYAELQSLTYHFGFHSLVAVFYWITRLPMTQSVLWIGQIINLFAVLSLYPLALLIRRNPWSGVFTVLLAGFVFSMPMYFLNWGRYTQLAGLGLLVIWAYLAWDLSNEHKFFWKPTLLAAIVLAGLALTHYRVLIFAIIFIVAILLWNFKPRRFVTDIGQMLAIGLSALLLALPWYINTLYGKLWFIFSQQITSPTTQLTEAVREANEIGNLFFYLPAWAWVILPILIGINLWKRQVGVALISLWWFLIFLAANPQWLNLPGLGILSSFTVMISLYIPASLIIGASLGWVVDGITNTRINTPSAISHSWRSVQLILPGLLCLLVALGCVIGLTKRIQDIDIQQNSLVNQPDLHAASWIEKNLPSNAKFLVNSFFAFNGSTVVGSDGGWWLPIIAGRQTTLPPMPYVNEKGPWPEYRAWINQLVSEIQEKGIDHPEIIQELKNRGIEYIYIGQKQGQMNSPGPLLLLDTLLANPHFEPVYHQDRVWIFKIKDQPG